MYKQTIIPFILFNSIIALYLVVKFFFFYSCTCQNEIMYKYICKRANTTSIDANEYSFMFLA